MPFLLDLRDQVDLEELQQDQARRGLARRQSRVESLAVLERVANRGRKALEPLLEQLLQQGTIEYYRFLRFRNRVFISGTEAALTPLHQHPAVAALIPEYDGEREARRSKGSGIAKAPPVPPGDSWGVEILRLRDLWAQGVDGRGVVVGILDSGIMGIHQALAPGMRDPKAWYDPLSGSPDPVDTGPHGSEVLSCAVGREVSGRVLGAAPGAQWVAALANPQNHYNNVMMSLAADWMIFEGQPDILLGAWGHSKGSCDDRDRDMIAAFRATGTIPIFAVGNDGPDPDSAQSPASLPGSGLGRGILAVAAVDRFLHVIPQSSRGPGRCGRTTSVPDLAAPGWEIPVPGSPNPNSLTLASGTSMSVGWVGGVAALVLQIQPDMPVAEVEDLLRRTARDLPPPGPDPDSGYGLIDPAAAVAAARNWKASGPGTAQ